MRKTMKVSALLFSVSMLFLGCQKENEMINTEPPTADAGSSQVFPSFVTTFSLTGTATSTNGAITGYLWSLVSGPNVPTITSPSSATTSVSAAVAGTYIFQFMAIDEAGLSGVDTTHVTIPAPVIQTVTFQPANNNENELHFVGPGTNLSSHDIDLCAGTWTIGGNTVFQRGAFNFNLSSIPATATIISAKLSLYSNPTPINGDQVNANSGSANAFYIRRITTPWNGNTATWQTQPSTTTDGQISIPHTSQAFLDLVDLDVKTLVDAMRTQGAYGFMMFLQNESIYNIRQFCSSNHANASKHPKLVIQYQ